ncbi:hypothetical protein [Pseudahrensia aquimaris]
MIALVTSDRSVFPQGTGRLVSIAHGLDGGGAGGSQLNQKLGTFDHRYNVKGNITGIGEMVVMMNQAILEACVFPAILSVDKSMKIPDDWMNIACFTCQHIIRGEKQVTFIANVGDCDGDELIALCDDPNHYISKDVLSNHEFGFCHLTHIGEISPDAVAVLVKLAQGHCSQRSEEGFWSAKIYDLDF